MSLQLGDLSPVAEVKFIVTIEGQEYVRAYLTEFEAVWDQLEEDGPEYRVGHNWDTTFNRRQAGLFEVYQLDKIIFDIACHGYKVSIELVQLGDR